MLGNRLKQCRTARNLSRKQLAEMSGVSYAGIRDIEGKESISRIDLDVMRKLCNALELKPNQVFPDAKRGETQREVIVHERRARLAARRRQGDVAKGVRGAAGKQLPGSED